MNNFLTLLLLILLTLNISLNAQTKVYGTIGPGRFLYHSDNSIEITENNNLKNFMNWDIGIELNLFKKHDIQIEFGYLYSRASGIVREITWTPDQITLFSADLIYESYPIDLSYLYPLNNWLTAGSGLSFAGTYRRITSGLSSVDFEDKLFSVGMGVNGLVKAEIPHPKDSAMIFIISTKLRYIYTIWFDKKGRNLDNYNLDFLQIWLSLGIGFNL